MAAPVHRGRSARNAAARNAHDPDAALAEIREDHIRQIRGILGTFDSFDFVLVDFGEFAASDTTAPVLYLAPDPAARFEELTVALVGAFPKYPPYGDEFSTVIPHLTVAHDHEAPLAEIRDDVAPALPISARAEEAWVMRQGDDGWRTASRIYFGRRGHD
jgi:hypothetical protein